jgi:hypothetical protein
LYSVFNDRFRIRNGCESARPSSRPNSVIVLYFWDKASLALSPKRKHKYQNDSIHRKLGVGTSEAKVLFFDTFSNLGHLFEYEYKICLVISHKFKCQNLFLSKNLL